MKNKRTGFDNFCEIVGNIVVFSVIAAFSFFLISFALGLSANLLDKIF